MTREEALENLNTLYMALAVFPNQQISLGDVDKMKESVDMAICALKQEDVLDKIRAEIEQEPYVSKMAVLDIIDEYRAESEGKDNAKSEVEVCSSNFIQLKQDVLNNKQLWRKLREIEIEADMTGSEVEE